MTQYDTAILNYRRNEYILTNEGHAYRLTR